MDDQTIYVWPGEPGIDAAGNQWHGRWDVTALGGKRHASRDGTVRLKAARCEGCGKRFCFMLSQSKGRFCSSACAARAVGGLGGAASAVATAEARAARKAARLAAIPMVECLACKMPFRQKRSGRGNQPVTCSRTCANRLARLAIMQQKWEANTPAGGSFCKLVFCVDCGATLRSRSGLRGRCAGCQKVAYRQAQRMIRRRRRHLGQEYKPETLARYKASGRPIEKGLTWRTVAARDGMECGSCGGLCRAPSRANTPDSASLGHIFPLSKGGPHAGLNCRIECKACNSTRFNHIDSDARWWRWVMRGTALDVGPSPVLPSPRALPKGR